MNTITLEEAKSVKLMTRFDAKYVITYAQYYDFINLIQDDELISFLENEEKKHSSIYEKLIECLKENCNE